MAKGKRTKGMRKKLGTDTYDSFVPFGADGKFVDMDSSLDLEEELKLGGTHNVTISENIEDDITTTNVTELYEGGYKVVTTIIESGSGTSISSKIYKTEDNEDTFLHRKTISILDDADLTEIKETLFDFDVENDEESELNIP